MKIGRLLKIQETSLRDRYEAIELTKNIGSAIDAENCVPSNNDYFSGTAKFFKLFNATDVRLLNTHQYRTKVPNL